jgi:hypothetical protein
MIPQLPKFNKGNPLARKKINQTTAKVNALSQIQGDGFILIKSTRYGYVISLNWQKVLSLLPKQKSGGSDIRLAYCKTAAGTGNTIVCFLDNPFPRIWSSTVIYAINKLVCLGGDEKVYVSLQNNNTNHAPATSPTWWKEIKNWNNTTTYAVDELAFGSDGLIYKSLQGTNLNHLITETSWWEKFGTWAGGTTYITGDIVFGSDDNYYTSLQDANAGHDPISSPLWWVLYPTITVTCKIYEGGENLQYCTVLLAVRDEMKVAMICGLWRSFTTFSPVCGGEA